MHEAMVAESVLQTVLAEAENQKGKPTSIHISCGTFNAINEEVLEFAFRAVAKGTSCEDVRLFVEQKRIFAHCLSCDNKAEYDIMNVKCGRCGSTDLEILPDAPMVLEEIEFEVE